MRYCQRCCYPENSRPFIIFDKQGVCSGCRLHESRPKIDWAEGQRKLKDILARYKAKAQEAGNPYDCIIPVSGGKDSHFQTYLMTRVYGMHPLLVCYNHTFNTLLGNRNLRNLVKQFNCDLIRFTTSPDTARRLSKYMLKKVGDITWHYHNGINTFPIQIAVKYKIPLIVWGEHGFADLLGMFNQNDMVEFSKKIRFEHSIRGIEIDDVIRDSESGITIHDASPFVYPLDDEIAKVGVRGIYLSNFINWDARWHTKVMIAEFGFETATVRERTFHTYDKLDDIHANGTHDYLKYLKFGYGRATDDASMEIRHRRMTREEGILMVEKYDHVRPSDLDIWLKFVGMTEEAFMVMVDPLRDTTIWEKHGRNWRPKDSIANHIMDRGVEEVRLPLVADRELLHSASWHEDHQTEYEVL